MHPPPLPPAPVLRQQTALGEPEIKEKERARDHQHRENAEHVVADAGRRLMNSCVPAGRVVRAARCDDEAEQHEQPDSTRQQSSRRREP